MEEKTSFFKENTDLIVFSVLMILVLVIYAQTVGFAFINLDDNLYIFNNPVIQKGLTLDTIRWAFNDFRVANWHPLTWISHALDINIFGLNPGGHHAANVLFHLINSILSFVVFRKLTGSFWKSAIVAAIFAVHPAHVESVAWVSERKDVLSTMFWLLTMFAYFRWNEEGSSLRSPYYYAAILLFALGLMAKPMLVTLPFVLLLCDFWALERWNISDLKCTFLVFIEKIPFFILSAVSSYITLLAQRSSGAVESLDFLPLTTRFTNALVAYAKYIGMMFYPAKLAVWYPYDRDFPVWQVALSIVLIAVITLLCLWQMRQRKYLLMGWLWFLGTLIPVIGIVQVGSQPMADRYTYIPYFGLLIMIVQGAFDVFEKFNYKKNALIAFFAVAVLILTILSVRQTALWRNNEILYKHTLSVTKSNFLISHNLCHYLTLQDRIDEAEPFCVQSIEAKPTYYEVFNTLGILQFKRKNYIEAEKNFKEAIKLNEGYALAYSNLALAYILQDKPVEAETNLQKASEINNGAIAPEVFVTALNDLSIAYAKQDKYEKSAENLNRLLYIAPDNTEARIKLALTYLTLKKYDQAQAQIEEIIRQNPNRAEVYNLYGLVLLEKKQNIEAAAQFEKALQIKPDFAEAKTNLEKAKGEK